MSSVYDTFTVWVVIKDEDNNEILSRHLTVEDVDAMRSPLGYFDFDRAYKFMTFVADDANRTSVEAL